MSLQRRLAAACLGLHAAAVTLFAQSTAPVPSPTGAPAGVVINGPAPPLFPEMLSRDDQGRVTLRATRIQSPLRIDGALDETLYQTTKPITGFVQTEPNRGAPATEQTEVWLFYDDEHIYVGARCYDSAPEDRWVANEMRRDSNNIVRGDNFAIYFDTYYDRRNAFLFEINPIGGIYDATVTNERSPGNIDYNPVWAREAGRFDKGWTAEMAIPFRILRYQPGRDQVWGINIRRTIRWKNEESFIQRMPPNQGSVIFQISLGGTLVGVDAPAASRNLEIKPYAIGGVTSDLRASPPRSNDVDKDAGFDVKYGVTPNLTADFTYNTDFAQVEVDEQQVNLTRFPLFFPEKREFFLEGQGIYDFGGASSTAGGGGGLTPLLFFSRRIGLNAGVTVPIDVGARLTGRIGKYTLGVIDVQTDDVKDALGASATPSTNFSVLRVKRDILRRSYIGVLATSRSHSTLASGASRAAGVDASLGFYDNWSVTGYYAKSDAPDVSEGEDSYRAQVLYNGDRYGMQYERLVVGDEFNPEVGFLRRADFGRHYGSFRFSPRPRRSRLVRKYSYSVAYDYIANPDGKLESRDTGGVFGITFQNGDSMQVSLSRYYEYLAAPFPITQAVRIPVGSYAFGDVAGSMTFGNQRKIAGTASLSEGSFYDGHRRALSFSGARVQLSPQFSVEPGVSLNFVDLPAGDFATTLISNRATYTVTPRMFVTGLLQYNSSGRSLSTNMRLRWEYQPGSELFVVYTDERDTALAGFPDLKNRAFVVKINRLLQF